MNPVTADGVAPGASDRLRRHWGTDVESVESSPRRVRGRVHRLFHVELEPTVRLTGWDRDLTDLVSGTPLDGEDLLDRVDAAMRATRRADDLPRRPRPASGSDAVTWAERRKAALSARERRAHGEQVIHRMTSEATASLLAEMWPGAEIVTQRDERGLERITARPYGGNRVSVGLSPRAVLVVPIADGEAVPLPGGRSSITDGSRSEVLAALESADDWLRTTAPVDEIIARPLVTE